MQGERNRGKEGGRERGRGEGDQKKKEGKKEKKIAKINHGKKPNTENASIVLLE